jgi:hypothetical protein
LHGGDNAVCEVRAARKKAFATVPLFGTRGCRRQQAYLSANLNSLPGAVITAVGAIANLSVIIAWRAWPGTAVCGSNNGRAAIIKLMQSYYPTSQAYTTARERWKCVLVCMGFPNLQVAAYLHRLEEAGVSQIYFLPAVEGSEVLWFAHAG